MVQAFDTHESDEDAGDEPKGKKRQSEDHRFYPINKRDHPNRPDKGD